VELRQLSSSTSLSGPCLMNDRKNSCLPAKRPYPRFGLIRRTTIRSNSAPPDIMFFVCSRWHSAALKWCYTPIHVGRIAGYPSERRNLTKLLNLFNLGAERSRSQTSRERNARIFACQTKRAVMHGPFEKLSRNIFDVFTCDDKQELWKTSKWCAFPTANVFSKLINEKDGIH
jgi:hypothetical protein